MTTRRLLILGMVFFFLGIFVTISEFQIPIEADTSNSEKGLESAEELYSSGLNLLQKQDYENAISYLEKAVKEEPTSAERYYSLGWNYNALGRYEEAINAYKQAIHIKPDYFEAYYNSALIYETLKQPNEVIRAYKQAIQIKPDYFEAYYNLGLTYANLRQPNEAIEVFKQAIQIRPNSAEVYFSIGREYSILKHREQTIKSYQEAIKLNPKHPKAHYGLGREYFISGDKKSAFKEYKILMRIDKQLADDLFPPPPNKFFRYTGFTLSVPFGIVMIILTLIFAIHSFYLFKKTLQIFHKMYFLSFVFMLLCGLGITASLIIFEISPFREPYWGNLSVGVIMVLCLMIAIYFLVRGMIIYYKTTKQHRVSDSTKPSQK